MTPLRVLKRFSRSTLLRFVLTLALAVQVALGMLGISFVKAVPAAPPGYKPSRRRNSPVAPAADICPTPVTFHLGSSGFTPAIANVTLGQVVTWVNSSAQTQTIRSDGLPVSIPGTPPPSNTIYLPVMDGGNVQQALAANGKGAALPQHVSTSSFPADAFSVTLAPGETYSRTLTNPGTLDFYVEGNPDIKGSATVDESLPPDPTTTAPPLDSSVPTSIVADSAFLYSGSNPEQSCLVGGTLDGAKTAVLQGRVLQRNGNPLPGTRVSILHHPEFGYTLTRSDGHFDLAVNGGQALTVQYQRAGFLPAQRSLDPHIQSYTKLDDVVLLQYDARVTQVDLSSSSGMQVARGTPQSDSDGTRQATLLFPQGDTAQAILPDGNKQDLSTLDVRLTEYTVGADGLQAMPGELPPTTGYTYAFDVSADQANLASATAITFTQPVPFYLENFLNFPTGTMVPVGYYDKSQAAWVPMDNGKVIKVLSVSGGMAMLDTDGDGQPDDVATLAALGISDAERAQLASLYAPGASLWRVPLAHFSPWDCNMSVVYSPGSVPPDQPPPQPPEDPPVDDSTHSNNDHGSLDYQNQTLQETLPIVGTPYNLVYSSDRVSGFQTAYTLKFPLSDSSLPTSVQGIDLQVSVAGRHFAYAFPAAPNQSYTFTWDGLDAYGRRLQGPQTVHVRIGYRYIAYYGLPSEVQRAFGLPSGVPLPDSVTRLPEELWQSYDVQVGEWTSAPLKMGSWSVDVHHIYDPLSKTLLLGDGSQRSNGNLASLITTVSPDPATLLGPSYLQAGSDRAIYFADNDGTISKIRKLNPDGSVVDVAGTDGIRGFGGDGGPATQASVNYPSGMAFGPDGSLYFADQFNARVRKIDPNGIITTVAGNGISGYAGDGGPATAARLDHPKDVALGPDGSLYIADSYNYRIRRVSPDGIISTVVGTGTPGYRGDGGPATQAEIYAVDSLAFGPDGSLYFSEARIRRMRPDGIIETVAGNGQDWTGSGPPLGVAAKDFSFCNITQIAFGLDGSLYVADSSAAQVYRIGTDGFVRAVAGRMWEQGTFQCLAGTTYPGYSGDGGPATAAPLRSPAGVTVGPAGDVYIADHLDKRIHKVYDIWPGLSNNEIAIPSAGSQQVYIFDGSGRHLRTLQALTGATLLSFGYNANGLLKSITDGDGNVTTFQRDAAGDPTAIVSPYGQVTQLSLANGYLSAVINPAGESTSLGYSNGGLLTRVTTPGGQVFSFTYGSDGRLTHTDNPDGGSISLARSELPDGHAVAVTTALGRTTHYSFQHLANGDYTQQITYPDGTQYLRTNGQNGTQNASLPDGTTVTIQQGPDPRFGMLAPYNTQVDKYTPEGLHKKTTTLRSVTLSNPDDIFSLQTWQEQVTVNRATSTSTFDAASSTFTNTTPSGRQEVLTIDSQGRPLSYQRGGTQAQQYSYDSHGLLAQVSQGSGADQRNTSMSYNSHGLLSSMTDAEGQATGFAYDSANRQTAITYPDGNSLQTSYDANGYPIHITTPGGQAYAASYTPMNAVGSYTLPNVDASSDVISYTYNLDQQPSGFTLPGGINVSESYDSSGRLKKISAPDGDTTFSYDSASGLLSGITRPDGGQLSQTYDGQLPTGQTWSGAVAGSVAITYTQDLRPGAEMVDGANPVAFSYDADGLLTGAGSLSLAWEPLYSLVSTTTLGGVGDAWSYDAFGQPAAYTATYNTSPLYAYHLTSDKLGRITKKVETIQGTTTTTTYSYDSAGHLAQVHQDGSLVASYSYDANGNRLSDGSQSGTYDDQDRLLHYGAASYTWSPAGDLQAKDESGKHSAYSYDVQGNLTGAALPDGTQITYLIDGYNRRIGKKVNGSLVQGWLYDSQLNPVAELDGSGNVVSRFVYGARGNVPAYMVKNGHTYRLISDHLGSVRLVVDTASGAVAQRLDYDAFGQVTQDTNPGFQPFGFAGGLYDPDTGLVRFGARDYDPHTGRFTSRDPLLLASQNSNNYAYLGSDPLNQVDPEGRGGRTWALIVKVDGQVQTKFEGSDDWITVFQSRLLSNPDDKIRTGPNSHAQIRMSDDNVYAVGPNTTMNLRTYEIKVGKVRVKMNLTSGDSLLNKIERFFRGKSRFEVETPNAVLSAQG